MVNIMFGNWLDPLLHLFWILFGIYLPGLTAFQLRDGQNSTSPLIGRYCSESEIPMPLTTNSSAIYVHFVTDDSVSSYGFRLEYITFGAYPGYHVDVTFC